MVQEIISEPSILLFVGFVCYSTGHIIEEKLMVIQKLQKGIKKLKIG